MRTRYNPGNFVKYRPESNQLRYKPDEVKLVDDTHIYQVTSITPPEKTMEGRTLYKLQSVTGERDKTNVAYASEIIKADEKEITEFEVEPRQNVNRVE